MKLCVILSSLHLKSSHQGGLMKLLITLGLLLASSHSFAYGTLFSLGTGISCTLYLEANPLTLHGCSSHVAKEVAVAGGSGVDFSGHKYATVTQTLDSVQCYNTHLRFEFDETTGDLSQDLSAELGSLTQISSSTDTSSSYKSTNGTIDLEERKNVTTHIYKEVDKNLAINDQLFLVSLKENNLHAMSITYNDQRKTLELEAVTKNGVKRISQKADFAKDVKMQIINFDLKLDTIGTNAPLRNYSATLSCNPLSKKK